MRRITILIATFSFMLSLATLLAPAGPSCAGEDADGNNPGDAAKYLPTWESLDAHPLPLWFDDAKFGMFIDYGLYSVAGWAPRINDKTKAMYPDWYVNRMYTAPEFIEYHKKTWGANFQRDNFIPLFQAKNYDPERIVRVAKDAGMRYIVLFCKHHDGFCLWPSSYTARDVGDMGPRRDLVKPLIEACRREGIRFGFYFSVDEWEYPIIDADGELKVRLWSKDPEEKLIPYDEKEMKGKISGKVPVKNFINDYIYPQVVEFIDDYDPDILWFDGEWDRSAEYYRTKEMVAYFYNKAEGRKEVVVNDRLGKGCRDVHGDVFTSEYGNRASDYYGQEVVKEDVHKWEENRGISQSFGYNREDTDENVQTPEQLIETLVDIVSRNGNLVLITNLDGQGAMPEIYGKRLLETGKWLKTNGEAIYGTKPLKGAGENGKIRYTMKQNSVYAICLEYPSGTFSLSNISPTPKTAVTLLGREGTLVWDYRNPVFTITVPELSNDDALPGYAYVFKIENIEVH